MADIEVNMVPDMEIDMVADTVATKVFLGDFFRPILFEPNLTLVCASSIRLKALWVYSLNIIQGPQVIKQEGKVEIKCDCWNRLEDDFFEDDYGERW